MRMRVNSALKNEIIVLWRRNVEIPVIAKSYGFTVEEVKKMCGIPQIEEVKRMSSIVRRMRATKLVPVDTVEPKQENLRELATRALNLLMETAKVLEKMINSPNFDSNEKNSSETCQSIQKAHG